MTTHRPVQVALGRLRATQVGSRVVVTVETGDMLSRIYTEGAERGEANLTFRNAQEFAEWAADLASLSLNFKRIVEGD